jgi:hypothetical protein
MSSMHCVKKRNIVTCHDRCIAHEIACHKTATTAASDLCKTSSEDFGQASLKHGLAYMQHRAHKRIVACALIKYPITGTDLHLIHRGCIGFKHLQKTGKPSYFSPIKLDVSGT